MTAGQRFGRLFRFGLTGTNCRQRWAMTVAAQLHLSKKPKLMAAAQALHTSPATAAGVPHGPAASPHSSPASFPQRQLSSRRGRRPSALTALASHQEAATSEAVLPEVAAPTGELVADTVAAEPAEQAQAGRGGKEEQQLEQPQKKKKALQMPIPIPPPCIPLDEAPWQNGVLLVDKPKTWTSFDVCAKLRGALKHIKVKKVGHAGTLDPMATGLLIVCVGRGTKAVDAFMAMTKEYSGTLRLGEGTPSYDADSEVDERLPWEHITDEELLAARDAFLGPIQQVPPMFSALRIGGKRLYEVARQGGEVERQPRSITVERFDLQRDAANLQDMHFRVVCSKGTYIRSLAHDLGRKLGTVAHLTALRREAIGEYRVDEAWQVQELTGQLLQQKKAAKEQQGRGPEGMVGEGQAAGAGEAAAAASELEGTDVA